MGYRLHFAKTYKVEHEMYKTFGNYRREEFASLLRDFAFDMWSSEDDSELEISKEDLKHAIEKLNQAHASDEPLNWMLKDGISYKDIADFLQAALDGADKDNDFVRFAWF